MAIVLVKGRRLFRRAIVHSGSAMASWAVARDHRAYTAALADRLNCTTPGDAGSSMAASRLVVHCLRQVAAADLVRAAADVASPPVKYLSAYGPTVSADNEVLPSSGVDALMDDACQQHEYVHDPVLQSRLGELPHQQYTCHTTSSQQLRKLSSTKC